MGVLCDHLPVPGSCMCQAIFKVPSEKKSGCGEAACSSWIFQRFLHMTKQEQASVELELSFVKHKIKSCLVGTL